MGVKFLKVVILAAVADGEIQDQELELINSMKKSHPMMKDVSDEQARAAMADIYNKVSAGMEAKHILEQLREEFSDEESYSAYAVAKEVCAADFKILPAETEFLKLLEDIWNIPEDIKSTVNKSLSLRYLI